MPSQWNDMSLGPEDIVHYPKLAAFVSNSHRQSSSSNSSSSNSPLFGENRAAEEQIAGQASICAQILENNTLQWKYDLVKLFNSELLKCLDLIDFNQLGRVLPSPLSANATNGSLPVTAMAKNKPVLELLSQSRGFIFSWLKDPIISKAIAGSIGDVPSTKFELVLSRSRAFKHASSGECDVEGRWAVFSQAFRRIHGMSAGALRRTGQLWDTVFAGERYVIAQ
jgi:hypothetical protein